jgi:hypothetical protein
MISHLRQPKPIVQPTKNEEEVFVLHAIGQVMLHSDGIDGL